MNIKEQLISLRDNDTTYNKNVFRYLWKTNSPLWEQVLTLTKFLPDNAMPKQRVWHILNDKWEIPKCPQTGEEVKWYDFYYQAFSSNSARGTYFNEHNIFKNQTSTAKKKREESNQKIIDAGQRKQPVMSAETKKLRTIKTQKTCLERYGVDNGSKVLAAREKNSQSQIDGGHATPKHLRSDKALYYEQVRLVTKENWNKHFDKINPNRYDRTTSGFELDHVYSQYQGFADNIPPYIIGHWTNLQMLSKSKNSSKRHRCYKTKDELFNDFFTNISC